MTGWAAAGLLLTTVAVVLAVPPEPGERGRGGPARAVPDGPVSGRRLPGAVRLLVAAACLGVAVSGLGARTVMHLGLVAGVTAVVAALAQRGRRRRAALALADRVLEACNCLADELRAGRSPDTALALAARGCPELEPAVRAVRLGADVPTALRRDGHRDLRLVAAAWQVSHRSGEGLGDSLARVADGLRAARATRRVVGSELASARSTARLLVALPVLALLAGSGGGGRPWEFLLTGPAGSGCLVAGLVLVLAGLWWIEQIADDVEQGS